MDKCVGNWTEAKNRIITVGVQPRRSDFSRKFTVFLKFIEIESMQRNSRGKRGYKKDSR